MNITLYNSRTRQKESFTPLDPAHSRLYVCGPTVYDRAHIGNARPVVVFDVLFRLLHHFFPQVTYVRNITDIDDKIIAAAGAQNISIQQLTEKTTQLYNQDMAALGALPPTIQPRATQHVPEMIQMIGALIEKNHAYAAQGHVLFDTVSDPNYGSLSRIDWAGQEAGARVDPAPYKKNPGDFVLWKPSTPQQPGWDSPWGFGRPGWHIECSAMARRYLGETFDIHGGGIDLLFPHHENERAQSCCATGAPFLAQVWMHNGHVGMNGEKMSKSLGNFLTVEDLLAHHRGETIRLALLSAQYRQPLNWTDSLLGQSARILDKFYTALKGCETPVTPQHVPTELLNALADDLNVPQALAVLHTLCHTVHNASTPAAKQQAQQQLKAGAQLLGLLQQTSGQWFQQAPLGTKALSASEIESLLAQRTQAKQTKNFEQADALRQQLAQHGIVVEDTPQGPTWRYS